MAWLQALVDATVDAVVADDLGGKDAGILAGVAIIVPFGWVLLLLRWPPLRRALGSLPEGVPPF